MLIKYGTMMQFNPFEQKFEISKIQDIGGLHLEKNLK